MQNVINLSVIIHLNNLKKKKKRLPGILIANVGCSAIGVAPVLYAISLALRREVDVLQITTYYSLEQCRLSYGV